MGKDVKVRRRRYDSTRRRQQADQTRREIVTAAGRLFRDRGYSVPMTAIAVEAGVVVETVYRTFGSKSALFRAVVEALLAGGAARAETPVEERRAIRAVIDEPDPRRQIALWVATQPGIHRRAGPVLRALHAGASSDVELKRLWDEMEAWRFEGQSRLVARLAAEGALRGDRSTEIASDIVFALTSLAVHDLLVLERGWTYEQYEEWLARALVRELLGDSEPTTE
jgi:AcrR family transcriptional regulator